MNDICTYIYENKHICMSVYRPNSPSAWTIADQAKQEKRNEILRKNAPAPGVPPTHNVNTYISKGDETSRSENSNRSDTSVYNRHDPSRNIPNPHRNVPNPNRIDTNRNDKVNNHEDKVQPTPRLPLHSIDEPSSNQRYVRTDVDVYICIFS
jgi:hypothetical protein